MKSKPVFLLLLGVGVANMCVLSADQPLTSDQLGPARQHRVTPINQAPGALMRSKLTSSQSVLAGVLRKDFDAIAAEAKVLKGISEAAEWPRSRDSVYEHFGRTFRRQCNELERAAETSNHDGVMFTYLSMTKTCVDCHDYVRDSRRIASQKQGGVQLIPSHWPASVSAGSQ